MKSPWSTYTDKTKLSVTEREELRGRLLAYMEYHPFHEVAPKRVSFIERMMHQFGAVRMIASVGIASLVVMVSTPFLAENANPGDMLYSVKTRVTEPLKGITLSTPEEKIAFEMKLLEKRVLETKLLVDTGELSKKAETDLSENIKRHTGEIQKNIEDIAMKSADEAIYAKVDLAAELSKTEEIVAGIVSEQPAKSLKKAVAEVKTIAVEQATIAATSSQDKVTGRIEQELSRAYELRASLEGKLTDEEVAEASRRFTRIEGFLRGEPIIPATTTLVSVASSTPETATTTVLVATSTPAAQIAPTADEILTRIKTLITYLSNTALRQSVPKEIVVPPTATTTKATE